MHENPEILFELPQTLAFVEEKLRSFGYCPDKIGQAGLCVTVGPPGKTILLRADMDALPMEEKSDLPFASRNGYAHTCGHDMHTAALLGAAQLLKENEAQLNGTVKIIFQPCEEGLGGMQDLLDHGLLENPKPDAAFALHVIGEKTGTLGIRPGYAGASCDPFHITIEGVGCHGAAAYMGVDPIQTAAHLITALQVLNSREVAPDEMLVVTVCMVHGGDAPNIIPDRCTLSGTIRTANQKTRAFAVSRVQEIAKTVAETFRAKATVSIDVGVPPMINDPTLAVALSQYADILLGQGSVWEIPAMTGSEDFALLCDHVPSVLGWFGTGGAAQSPYSNHHPAIIFDEDALPLMAAVHAHCATAWLSQHQDA